MGELRFPLRHHARTPAELVLQLGEFYLVGTSIAARATAFALPRLGLAVDVGRLTPTLAAQPTLLITHAHLDHTAGLLAYLNLRARANEAPCTVWVPAPIRGALVEALRHFPGMESVHKRMDLQEVIRPAQEDLPFTLPDGTVVQAFAVEHGIPTLGWAVTPAGGKRPLVVFAADGDPRWFQQRPQLLEAQVAVVECTYVGENRRLAARLSLHAHLLDWVELAPQLPCEVLVLAHLPEGPIPRRQWELLAQVFPGTLVVWQGPSSARRVALP
ncbi:MAG: MBL fold metallo-hydrolase [Thermoanaerobaculum sp.]|nr:MBL fold metallo-hydrolase [Thermoanaerobaculum sp.]MDW7968540.1 MBL fold metallo-hydrolase [Thermoanaerobaculum sp.]